MSASNIGLKTRASRLGEKDDVGGLTGLFATLDLNLPQEKNAVLPNLGSLDGLEKSYTLGLTVSKTFSWGDPKKHKRGILSASAKGGPAALTWYHPDTLAEESGTRRTYGGSLLAGFNTADAQAAYLRVQASNTYKESKSKTMCPSSTGGLIQCVTGPIGEPTGRKPRVVGVEYGVGFPWLAGTGMSVTYNRDVQNHVNGIEVPAYLYSWQTSGKPSLSVGLLWSWTDDPSSQRRRNTVLLISTDVFEVLKAK